MNKPPFSVDIVGSFLRPQTLKDARAKFAQGAISKEELTHVENEEIIRLIKKQKDVGLSAVTDGEFRRRWWHLDFIAEFKGISVFDFETQGFQGRKMKAQGTYVSDKLEYHGNHPFLSHFQFTQKHAEETLAKQTIPGPGMIYLDSYILSERYAKNPVYHTVEEFLNDLISIYQKVIADFYNVGCRYLQLDDTSWGGLFSEKFRKSIVTAGFDPDSLISQFGELTKRILADKPSDMIITHHFCRGNFMSSWLYEGTYDKIAQSLLSIEEIDGFFWEYDSPRSGDFTPLRYLKNQKIVLGLVTTKTPELENKSEIINRVKQAEKYVPLEQICISPQCGFASTEEGNHLTEDDQWKKIELLQDIAKEIF